VRLETVRYSTSAHEGLGGFLQYGCEFSSSESQSSFLLQVDDLSSIRVYIAKDLRPLEARERAARSVDEVLRRFPNGVPTLDPEEDMQVGGQACHCLLAFLSKVQDVSPRFQQAGARIRCSYQKESVRSP
jgi:hypothetical protein